jgi:hypothetical protein
MRRAGSFCKLRGQRYRNPGNKWLAKFIQEELFTFDYEETAAPTPTLAACGIAKIAKPTGSKL